MKYFTIPPPDSLKPFVRCFWVLEHDFGEGENSYVYRSIADSCVEMVFHYRGRFNELDYAGQARNWLSGIHFQTDRYTRFEANESFGIFGVYVYPFAVPWLFNVPSEKTSNELLDLDTFFGFAGRELEERIMSAPDNDARVQLLTRFLEKRLLRARFKDSTIAAAIKHVIHTKQWCTVGDLAEKTNLSTRQFDRKFKEYAGFSPKTYLRLVRLNHAIKGHKSNKSLTQIAYECGYYDQSHFIHDVKAFTGYHPGFYFSGKAEGTEYLYV
ncbi:MAG TPA: helix-turn-helix domain-containing protein [Mucilaginibacter sp.]|jgi:AraC-like DNA-binding protein|nr:helix-turn-helix domain-containing protein [Mucilaginibacter sp.]